MANDKEPANKVCFKCGVGKAISEFYRHPGMADGYLNKCKDCAKRDVRKNRSDRLDYYRAYDKQRFRNDLSRRLRNEAYAKTPEGKEAIKRFKQEWIRKNPEKRAAHVILGNAIRSGRVEKPDSCSRCGMQPFKSRHLHGHHHDYARPLDVEWICVWCHVLEHQ